MDFEQSLSRDLLPFDGIIHGLNMEMKEQEDQDRQFCRALVRVSQKWPRKFEQAAKWKICYLLKAPVGLNHGAEDGEKNEAKTLSGVQSQGGVGSDGWRQDAGRTGAAV